ncbi:alpha/beta-hydrolase, partial [Aureobasidium melanogenum]
MSGANVQQPPLQPIVVEGDSRVRRCSVNISGKTYGYLLAEPEQGFAKTCFLIHGFPDLSVAWRNQIPVFLQLGFRVVCPDCIGYGRSYASEDDLSPYTLKSHVEDFRQLALELGANEIVVGGHDWGAAIAWRMALYYPSFVTHLIAVAMPYIPPTASYIDSENLLKAVPTLGYWRQYTSGTIESQTRNKEEVRAFLNAEYCGATDDGKLAFDPTTGVNFDLARHLSPSPLMSEVDMEYYVDEYNRQGLRGPCNYYRTRQHNFEDEKSFAKSADLMKINCPALYIHPSQDMVISKAMIKPMGFLVSNLMTMEVDANHWALLEKPGEVNSILLAWLEDQFGS